MHTRCQHCVRAEILRSFISSYSSTDCIRAGAETSKKRSLNSSQCSHPNNQTIGSAPVLNFGDGSPTVLIQVSQLDLCVPSVITQQLVEVLKGDLASPFNGGSISPDLCPAAAHFTVWSSDTRQLTVILWEVTGTGTASRFSGGLLEWKWWH